MMARSLPTYARLPLWKYLPAGGQWCSTARHSTPGQGATPDTTHWRTACTAKSVRYAVKRRVKESAQRVEMHCGTGSLEGLLVWLQLHSANLRAEGVVQQQVGHKLALLLGNLQAAAPGTQHQARPGQHRNTWTMESITHAPQAGGSSRASRLLLLFTNVPCHRRPACLPQHLPCMCPACPAHLCRGRQCSHAAVHVLQQGLQLLLAELAFEVQVCQGTAAGSTKSQGPDQACKPVPGVSTRTQSLET